MSGYANDSIFWVEVDRISPNPYQPRKAFDEAKLQGLADSIRQYGILQPLVVTKVEVSKDDGGIAVSYELIVGERRLRASKIAGLSQVPVLIRNDEETNQMKLELAIIENLQREDLNPIDRAVAFEKLAREFNFKHIEIARKVGKSREYVSNTMRLLGLPTHMQESMRAGEITEGHGRPLLMLNDKPDEQQVVYREICLKKLTVREAEAIARRIAVDKVRKKSRGYDPEIIALEQQLTESLGTRVQIESREVGGKVIIDFFSNDDLRSLLDLLSTEKQKMMVRSAQLLEADSSGASTEEVLVKDEDSTPSPTPPFKNEEMGVNEGNNVKQEDEPKEEKDVRYDSVAREMPASDGEQHAIHMSPEEIALIQNDTPITEVQEEKLSEELEEDDEDLYSIRNFSV